MTRLFLFVALVTLLAGCGDAEETVTVTETATVTETTTADLTAMMDVRVYLLREGKLWPAARQALANAGLAIGGLVELRDGPTEMERADLQLTTAVPERGGISVSIRDRVAKLETEVEFSKAALAQIVYTLTHDPRVKSVELEGRRLIRADFEEFTPAILVESPLAFEEVGNPIRVTGTANTFEATFQYNLTDTDGRIVDEDFVTATSGSGERGTFDFTTKEYEVPFDGVGSLIVFEVSAEDGSRINLVEIPVRMRR